MNNVMLELLKTTDPIDDIINIQGDFLNTKPRDQRKKLGQFFTGITISDYMASLVKVPNKKSIRILDAGAGAGILTASTALHCLNEGSKSVHAVLYELDKEAIQSLKQTMDIVRNIFEEYQSSFTFEIRCEDFILARPDKDASFSSFDLSVINPPYFKYSAKSSCYAKAVCDLYRGDPNVYASFMAIVMNCLKDKGQMISISPRSFTNGLYFKGFRQYLLNESSLDLVHVFKSRNKIFKNAGSDVLQENIISRFIKGSTKETVTIRSSDSDSNINDMEEHRYPIDLIIDPSNDQSIIRIPESSYEANILKQAETLATTFENAGYFISTGRIVEHRTREYITNSTSSINSVPLYRPHNILQPLVKWDGNHKKEVSFKLLDGHSKHTIKNDVYVLLKRISSKDEKRRLVAGVYLAEKNNGELIGFGNKLNYIGATSGKLSTDEAHGISAVLNSSFMDTYFRCISGNTQVNATEIRIMKFPAQKQIKEIGRKVKKIKQYSLEKINLIVNEKLGIKILV